MCLMAGERGAVLLLIFNIESVVSVKICIIKSVEINKTFYDG